MDRRMFLATTMTAGVISAAPGSRPRSAAESDVRDLTKANIPTPALIVDLDAFEANLQTMAEHCRRAGCGFRPHAKTHKCPQIAQKQIAAGALGICVATVGEAEAMAASGIRGILLTSPIVDPLKIGRVVDLARHGGAILMAVGHPREIELLADAADAAHVRVQVLVDLDVGDKRTGALPGPSALDLARQIGRHKSLELIGVQAYAGHASHTVGFENRQRVSQTAIQKAVDTKALLKQHGFNAGILSGGSTGTYNIDSHIDGMTELQVGSYIFMDVDYRRIGGRDGNAVYNDFRPSLTVLTTVVSAAHPERITVDAGTKAVDTTTSHAPQFKDRMGLSYARAGDEFGAITAEAGAKLPELGERIELIVPHCDPSVNLYDRLYACRGERVEAIWDVAARREFRAANL
jgi:D-serine deaminase-like pyridoxal phosphate-dependent protein